MPLFGYSFGFMYVAKMISLIFRVVSKLNKNKQDRTNNGTKMSRYMEEDEGAP
jgi:hypothetical protein|eukprot:evm.model.NODE_17210_length_5462_cov_21.913036.1